ncbi:MAG: Holliday junction branch migration protein RuvA [Helicobacter sp.]|uniref:Holliday junction branch migration protein RuvA n=1 Tax=Helicobacter sp. 10-6591 TaxID=2004998 RepID=UPI000DCBEBF5|nr:Holliday junction branch migration protein RuvA [Helicobacter sp. 10-6591]MCI6217818.1 Holliday junction branch migration protein RuvA [Helicobacter sp.]MDD7567142.1 Holliday junction branch migration protein RuvA [Helicobacter sp.]MDY5740832.1 Holliday junction branch migration protein RuvA [Helicobacter sp.]RAX56235.1 Holliday junction branch migration protein RuvA [Helicobacter sp. 10-6591]
MIVGLRGYIENLEATFLEINVRGVIYGLGISMNTSTKLAIAKENGEEVYVFCLQIIREDNHLLFGFADKIERISFERLIKVNGVGPKVALTILSTYTPQSFADILQNKDIKALQRVPGIGAKSAGKIMVDLAGFFDELIVEKVSTLVQNDRTNTKDVFFALESLGFKSTDISNVLGNIKLDNMSITQITKEALKLLAKK